MIHWSRYNDARERLSRRLMAVFALRLQFAFSGVPDYGANLKQRFVSESWPQGQGLLFSLLIESPLNTVIFN
jgi:hypothetical protein